MRKYNEFLNESIDNNDDIILENWDDAFNIITDAKNISKTSLKNFVEGFNMLLNAIIGSTFGKVSSLNTDRFIKSSYSWFKNCDAKSVDELLFKSSFDVVGINDPESGIIIGSTGIGKPEYFVGCRKSNTRVLYTADYDHISNVHTEYNGSDQITDINNFIQAWNVFYNKYSKI